MTPEEMIAHVNNSVVRSLRGEAYFDDLVLNIRGFSTPTIRRLFSNLCHIDIPMPVYLECGVWCGATFCAAVSGNPDLIAYGVDDFSQDFSCPTVKAELENALKHFANATTHVFHEDCFTLNALLPKPIDIFFFDAEHSTESQAKALPYFLPVMASTFIYIVDDTNWDQVRRGMMQGIDAVADKITVLDYRHLSDAKKQDGEIWHNAVDIFVIQKSEE